MYTCTKCNQSKPQEEFPTRKNRPKSVISFCFICRREYAKEWYKNNKDKAVEISKKSHSKNREKNLLRHSLWYQRNIKKQQQYGVIYYYNNREKILSHKKEKYPENKEKLSAINKEWRIKNAEYVKKRAKEWYKKNYAKIRMYYAKRQQYILQATPVWADLKRIEKIYTECERKTLETGINHEVDHIVPLNNSLICGLHVPENLQILTASENSRKGNRYKV